MDGATLRAWWAKSQGLDGSLEGADPATVLTRSGWARSVGGVGPYLTLYSRARISRETADAAAAALEIGELPAARGCTYVLPAADFALGLAVARAFNASEMKVAASVGVTEQEIDRLCQSVVASLGKEPLEPAAIRDAAGGAVRNLGEAGKKKGLTTTLPIALGRLQVEGEIRRVPTNGRLDQQRYAYARWLPNPLSRFRLSAEQAITELGRRFFGWVGPATIGEFQWFSGLGAKVSTRALESLGLVPMEPGSDRLLLPEQVEAFRSFKAPKKPNYVLVSSLDSISAARRNVATLLADEDRNRRVVTEKNAQAAGSLTDLAGHAILDRGRIVGFWEYDADSSSIVWAGWVEDKALDAAVKDTERFVRDQLGDARSFSLDSPKSRAPKIAALKKLG